MEKEPLFLQHLCSLEGTILHFQPTVEGQKPFSIDITKFTITSSGPRQLWSIDILDPDKNISILCTSKNHQESCFNELSPQYPIKVIQNDTKIQTKDESKTNSNRSSISSTFSSFKTKNDSPILEQTSSTISDGPSRLSRLAKLTGLQKLSSEDIVPTTVELETPSKEESFSTVNFASGGSLSPPSWMPVSLDSPAVHARFLGSPVVKEYDISRDRDSCPQTPGTAGTECPFSPSWVLFNASFTPKRQSPTIVQPPAPTAPMPGLVSTTFVPKGINKLCTPKLPEPKVTKETKVPIEKKFSALKSAFLNIVKSKTTEPKTVVPSDEMSDYDDMQYRYTRGFRRRSTWAKISDIWTCPPGIVDIPFIPASEKAPDMDKVLLGCQWLGEVFPLLSKIASSKSYVNMLAKTYIQSHSNEECMFMSSNLIREREGITQQISRKQSQLDGMNPRLGGSDEIRGNSITSGSLISRSSATHYYSPNKSALIVDPSWLGNINVLSDGGGSSDDSTEDSDEDDDDDYSESGSYISRARCEQLLNQYNERWGRSSPTSSPLASFAINVTDSLEPIVFDLPGLTCTSVRSLSPIETEESIVILDPIYMRRNFNGIGLTLPVPLTIDSLTNTPMISRFYNPTPIANSDATPSSTNNQHNSSNNDISNMKRYQRQLSELTELQDAVSCLVLGGKLSERAPDYVILEIGYTKSRAGLKASHSYCKRALDYYTTCNERTQYPITTELTNLYQLLHSCRNTLLDLQDEVNNQKLNRKNIWWNSKSVQLLNHHREALVNTMQAMNDFQTALRSSSGFQKLEVAMAQAFERCRTKIEYELQVVSDIRYTHRNR